MRATRLMAMVLIANVILAAAVAACDDCESARHMAYTLPFTPSDLGMDGASDDTPPGK